MQHTSDIYSHRSGGRAADKAHNTYMARGSQGNNDMRVRSLSSLKWLVIPRLQVN
ncbi:hypothetical protein Pr1d_31130 [Bythopirellula goksoeyrii]|uniref:Uncharacterized protein n=1 Tax=Bythopirellula goksoeyrii TaxID=1400387 RepID=A0A5B9QA04_9BACT|nr:hypothetical protein Pr1d_31130 [Bythopirellula goksoeyrii]